MAIRPTLTEQLATLGMQLPAWPDEPEGARATGDWIERGQAYAEGVRLWRARLSNAPESTKGALGQLIRNLTETGQLNMWDLWAATATNAVTERQDNNDEWIFRASAHSEFQMTPAQTVAAMLEAAREGNHLPAAEALEYLIDLKVEDQEQIPILVSLLIEEVSGMWRNRPLETRESEAWLAELQEHVKLIDILKTSIALTQKAPSPSSAGEAAQEISQKIKLLTSQSNASNGTPRHSLSGLLLSFNVAIQYIDSERKTKGLGIMENAVDKASTGVPPEINENSWKQLLINSAANRTKGPRRILLVESKSLPRSGHHYLKAALQAGAPDQFSYCEYYHEPGCCKQAPCNAEPYWRNARNQDTGHVRLVKSHDFLLEDPAYTTPDGVIRLVQVRRPLNILTSWLELEQLRLNRDLLDQRGISFNRICYHHEKELLQAAYALIDSHGVTMEQEAAAEWLSMKVTYMTNFTEKWVPLCMPVTELAFQASGTYLVRYEDLGQVAPNLSLLFSGLDDCKLLLTSHPSFNPRQSATASRRSARFQSLLALLGDQLLGTEKIIVDNWSKWELLRGYKQICQ